MYKLILAFALAMLTTAGGIPMHTQVNQIVIDHLPKSTQTYVGSPSITLLPMERC